MSDPIYEAYIRQNGHITDPDERIMCLDGRICRVKRMQTLTQEDRIKAMVSKYLPNNKVYKDEEDGSVYIIKDAAEPTQTHGEQIASLLRDDEYVTGPDFITPHSSPRALQHDYALNEGDVFPIYKVPKNELTGKIVTLKSGTFRQFTVKVTAVTPEKVYFDISLFGQVRHLNLPLSEFLKGMQDESIKESVDSEDGVDRVRVCSDCEREYGPFSVKPGQQKTNTFCRRHYLKMLQAFAKSSHDPKFQEEMQVRIQNAKAAPDSEYATDLSTRILHENYDPERAVPLRVIKRQKMDTVFAQLPDEIEWKLNNPADPEHAEAFLGEFPLDRLGAAFYRISYRESDTAPDGNWYEFTTWTGITDQEMEVIKQLMLKNGWNPESDKWI